MQKSDFFLLKNSDKSHYYIQNRDSSKFHFFTILTSKKKMLKIALLKNVTSWSCLVMALTPSTSSRVWVYLIVERLVHFLISE